MEDLEFELRFFDETMTEGEGNFDNIIQIMANESQVVTNWMLRTELELIFDFAMCSFVLHFFSSRSVWIMKYNPSGQKDVLYNPDIRCLSEWCQANGWDVPCPDFELVDNDTEFWKYFWEVNLIDSDYIEHKFGARQTVLEEDDDVFEDDE
jgi:hypothetical protein